jgi:polysaccharide chain length determinant protein (PEP-CTERM system associated)
MAEDFEAQESQPLDLSRVVDLVRRRHLQFLVPLFLGWILVWGSSWFLQARYMSSTLILVEEPNMPKNYVTPNVNDDLQARLQSISQQILSRTRLLMIIDKQNLYNQKKNRPLTPDDKVDLMRKDIGIDLVRDRDQSITAFRINYTAPSPAIAQEVTSKLTNLFIDENLKVRQQLSQDTTEFIQTQLDDARKSLAAQEAKIRDFQSAHEGELPTQQSTNLQILSGLQAQYQNEQQALNTAKQQRIYFQTMLDQYRTLQRSTTGGGDGTPSSLAVVDQQLEKMRAQLTELSSHYTDNYPDVQQLKSQIAKTEKIRSNLVAELKKSTSKEESGTAAHEIADLAQNPQLIQLQGQLHSTQVEIQNREQELVALDARIGQYQARLQQEPVSEQQLAELTRGYEQSKSNYDELLKKENESRMATNMEELQRGERFTILDPPSLPLKAVFPNRLKMCGMGFVVGIVLGTILVVILEFLDDRMHGDKEIKKLLPTAIISEVPEIQTVNDKTRNSRSIVFGWAVAALVLVCILVGSAFSYLHS